MNVCSNFTLSLTGSFHECRHCGREKKFHRLDFETNNIEYVQKASNNNAAKFQQEKLQQLSIQKQAEEDELRAKACNNFVLALVGQFQQCGNCKIEKKFHKFDTAGQIAYQPKSQVAKPASQTQQQTKVSAVAEIVQETMMAQSVKDRIAQMNKKVENTNEPRFRPSIKRQEVQEKLPGQAEIVTEQVFTSVSDQKSVFDKQRVRKTMQQSTQQIREQQNPEVFRKAESQFITSSENTQEQQEQIIQNEQNEQNKEESVQQDETQQLQQQDDQNKEQQHQEEQEQQQEQQVVPQEEVPQEVHEESNNQEQVNNQNEQIEEFQQQNDQHLDEQQDIQERQDNNDY